MTVIAFRDLDGVGIGCMIHYGAHCTASGANKEITRDWAGVMCDILESETGMPVAFFAGQSGDTGPRISNGKTTGNIKYAEQLGALAGLDATRAYKSIKYYDSPSLALETEKSKYRISRLYLMRKLKKSLKNWLIQQILWEDLKKLLQNTVR